MYSSEHFVYDAEVVMQRPRNEFRRMLNQLYYRKPTDVDAIGCALTCTNSKDSMTFAIPGEITTTRIPWISAIVGKKDLFCFLKMSKGHFSSSSSNL